MVRTQIQLDEETFETVRGIAYREHLSISEVVRRCLRQALKGGQHGARRRKLTFIGAGASGRADLSERHDEALAEDFR